ncbi:MAG: hypothetical protein WCR01_00235 [Bacteroidota bacterium]
MQNRRQFINLLVRGSILSVLAMVSGTLFRRWSEADPCRQDYTCGRCDLSKKCNLPAARKFRGGLTNTSDGRISR